MSGFFLPVWAILGVRSLDLHGDCVGDFAAGRRLSRILVSRAVRLAGPTRNPPMCVTSPIIGLKTVKECHRSVLTLTPTLEGGMIIPVRR